MPRELFRDIVEPTVKVGTSSGIRFQFDSGTYGGGLALIIVPLWRPMSSDPPSMMAFAAAPPPPPPPRRLLLLRRLWRRSVVEVNRLRPDGAPR